MKGTLIVLLPLCGDDLERANWRLCQRSLLERAVDMVKAVEAISRVFAVVDQCSMPTLPVEPVALEKVTRLSEFAKDYAGVMTLDPLRPWRSSTPLKVAVERYFEQSSPRGKVVSVASVPNHFHPRKVLRLAENGTLSYYDPEGARILRRQQLASDPVYVVTNALSIEDPGDHGGLPPMAVVIEETRLRIESETDLGLAGALLDRWDTKRHE